MAEKKKDVTEEAIGKPERITVDGQSVTQRGADDLIRLDQYNRAKGIDPFKALRRRKVTH